VPAEGVAVGGTAAGAMSASTAPAAGVIQAAPKRSAAATSAAALGGRRGSLIAAVTFPMFPSIMQAEISRSGWRCHTGAEDPPERGRIARQAKRRREMTVTIYHNPRCTKSRQTLELLRSRGVEPKIIEYLKTPPTAAELKRILRLLGRKPRELMRRSEDAYRELKLDDPKLGDDALIAAMANNPILIERPIVLANGKAALGRPPESVLDIL
jgi:arsenate reductase